MKKLNVNTRGNAKLKNTDKVHFLIWNLPSQTTCPYATDLCKKSCYAKRAERYPSCKNSRQQNYYDSLEYDFTLNMIYTIELLINSNAIKGKKIYFRIHESGDFYNQEYFDKWLKVITYFEGYENLTFLAYTKSIPFLIGSTYAKNHFPTNFVIRSSIWSDTREDLFNLTFKYNLPIFTALPNFEDYNHGKKFVECPGVNCGTCLKCYSWNYKDIAVKIH